MFKKKHPNLEQSKSITSKVEEKHWKAAEDLCTGLKI